MSRLVAHREPPLWTKVLGAPPLFGAGFFWDSRPGPARYFLSCEAMRLFSMAVVAALIALASPAQAEERWIAILCDSPVPMITATALDDAGYHEEAVRAEWAAIYADICFLLPTAMQVDLSERLHAFGAQEVWSVEGFGETKYTWSTRPGG